MAAANSFIRVFEMNSSLDDLLLAHQQARNEYRDALDRLLYLPLNDRDWSRAKHELWLGTLFTIFRLIHTDGRY